MIKQYLPRIFFCMGVTAFIFGLIGFNAFDAFDSKNIFKALINTLQMYVLNLSANEFNDFFKKNPGSFKNVLLVIAAFLAPLSTIGALLAAFGQRISHWFDLHIKSLWQTTDYVFIGGGVMASSISQRICENNKKIKIIGLDLNEN